MRINAFQAVFPKLEKITSTDTFFATMREDYNSFREKDFFGKKNEFAIYIYTIQCKHGSYTGLITCTNIQDYLDEKIIKHEQTLKAKEANHLELTRSRNAMVKPVLLTYPPTPSINAWMLQYKSSHTLFLKVPFPQLEEVHFFWQVKEKNAIQNLQALFSAHVPKSYIADGHHRSSTLALLHQQNKSNRYNQLLTAYFATDQLQILAFNRVVRLTDSVRYKQFLAHLEQYCLIKPLDAFHIPKQKNQFTLLYSNHFYQVEWKKSTLDQFSKQAIVLDTRILNEIIFKKIIGIKDPRRDLRVEYIGGPLGLDGLQQKLSEQDNSIGFYLFPTALHEIIQLADLGAVLPPKSTWFEPRMKNALITKEY